MDFKPKYLLQDKTFKKTFKKYRNGLSETDRSKLRERFEIFTLSYYYAFSVSYSNRIVFRILDDGGVLLVDIGSHDEVH
jgi:hypothetical protein